MGGARAGNTKGNTHTEYGILLSIWGSDFDLRVALAFEPCATRSLND